MCESGNVGCVELLEFNGSVPTRAQPLQHRVEQLAALVDGWPPAVLGLGDEQGEDLPAGVGQVGAVAVARRVTTGSLTARDGEAPQHTACQTPQMTFSDTL